MSTAERVILSVSFSGVAAGTDEEKHVAMPLPGEWRVVSTPYIAPDTATAAHAANYSTITVKQGSSTIASWSTQTAAQGALTKGTAAAMVYAETGAGAVIGQGDTLEVGKADSGTGAGLDGSICIPLERFRG